MTGTVEITAQVSLDDLEQLVGEIVEQQLTAKDILYEPIGQLLTAAQASARYGRPPRWWRYNADEFEAVRLGDGRRPPPLFDSAKIERRLNACSAGRKSEDRSEPVPERNPPRRRRARNGTNVDPLPINPPKRRGTADD